MCDEDRLSAAKDGARSVGDVRGVARTGVHIDDPTSALCGFPAMEAFAKEQSAVALLVRRAAGSNTTLSRGAGEVR
jgi:hypothetical protein